MLTIFFWKYFSNGISGIQRYIIKINIYTFSKFRHCNPVCILRASHRSSVVDRKARRLPQRYFLPQTRSLAWWTGAQRMICSKMALIREMTQFFAPIKKILRELQKVAVTGERFLCWRHVLSTQHDVFNFNLTYMINVRV